MCSPSLPYYMTFLMLQKLIFAATTAAFLTTATIDKLAMDTSMAKQ